MKNFDVVVIGSGAAGQQVALDLSHAGKSVAVVEKFRVGGEPPYVSSIPSKAMIRSSIVRADIQHSVDLGATANPVEMGDRDAAYAQAIKRRNQISLHQDDAVAATELVSAGIELFRGVAHFTDDKELKVGAEILGYTDLVIAVGSTPSFPEVPGIENVSSWTSDDALTADEMPESVLIIGGGPIGAEFAQMYAGFGIKTTIVEFGPQLAGHEHPAVAQCLAENLQALGVTIHLGAKIDRTEPTDTGLSRSTLSNGAVVIAEQIIFGAGRHPNTEDLHLEKIGISTGKNGAVEIDSQCRVVGHEHVWAAGDVTNIFPLIHTAHYQARIVTQNILGDKREANYSSVPRTIYTNPPIASAGTMPTPKNVEGIVLVCFDLAQMPRTKTDGTSGGVLILAADPKKRVLVGASAIAPRADEWMSEIALAVRAEIPLSVLLDVVHAYPTFAQAFELALRELDAKLTAISAPMKP